MRFEDCICVGLIGSPHGVKGYVKVKHFTESHRGVTAYGEVFNDKMEKIILDFKGLSKNLGIYSIKGITNRDLAESFRGIKLFVKKNNLPSLTNGDVYHFDIIGLNVIDKDGNQKLGTIKNILNFGAGDIAEILSNEGDFFVPLMPNDLDHIDSKKGTIFLSNFDKWKNINK